MGRYTLTLVILLVLACFYNGQAVNPGVQLRISQPGLNYAAQVALEILGGNLKGESIPDQSGEDHLSVGKVEYSLTGMRITSFGSPSSKVTVQAGKGFTWSGNGGSIALHGDWHYKYKVGFIHVKDHGSFDVSINGMNFAVSITLGAQSGVPTIRSTGCNCNVQDVHVKFHGGASWLYNLFDDKVEHILKDKINDMFCDAAQKAINVQAQKSLATMKLKVPIGNSLVLDYSFVKPPTYAAGYMDAFLKGEVFYQGDTTESKLTQPAIPASTNATKMVYIWLTDYLMDTMGQVLNKHKALEYNLTRSDLPAKEQYLLNTTCALVCVGTTITQLKKYPNSDLQMHMRSTGAPKLDLGPGHINGQFVGVVDNYVHMPNGTTFFAFSMDLNVSFSLSVQLQTYQITAKVQNYKFSVKTTNSKIGPVAATGVQWLFNSAAKQFVVKKLNEVGSKGFELPAIDNAEYVHPELELFKDVLYLSTDIMYKPSSGKYKKWDKDVLHYNEYKIDK